MSELISQPPNPEDEKYKQFFSFVEQFTNATRKRYRRLTGELRCTWGSVQSPLKLLFTANGRDYSLRVTATNDPIPLSLLGIDNDEMRIAKLDIHFRPQGMSVRGRFIDTEPGEWDPEISELKPSTEAVLQQVILTSPEPNK